MPGYEANVLDRFADLCDLGMVERGSRPVFWSVSQQRILSEGEFTTQITSRDSLVSMHRVTTFGPKADKIARNYPDVKLLVFTEDAWQIAGA